MPEHQQRLQELLDQVKDLISKETYFYNQIKEMVEYLRGIASVLDYHHNKAKREGGNMDKVDHIKLEFDVKKS